MAEPPITITGLRKYWGENLREAKEKGEAVSGMIGFAIAGLAFAMHWFKWPVPSLLDSSAPWIGWIAGGYGFLSLFVWLPYKRHAEECEKHQRETAAVEKQIEGLRESMRPKLKVECREDILGCHTSVTRLPYVDAATGQLIKNEFYRYYRASVKTDKHAPVSECKGLLVEIARDGEVLWGGDTQEITFAPASGSDTFAKSIHSNGEFLDILGVSDQGQIVICAPRLFWRFAPPLAKLFSQHGRYQISVLILGKGISDVPAKFYFDWKGNWNDSRLTYIEN